MTMDWFRREVCSGGSGSGGRLSAHSQAISSWDSDDDEKSPLKKKEERSTKILETDTSQDENDDINNDDDDLFAPSQQIEDMENGDDDDDHGNAKESQSKRIRIGDDDKSPDIFQDDSESQGPDRPTTGSSWIRNLQQGDNDEEMEVGAVVAGTVEEDQGGSSGRDSNRISSIGSSQALNCSAPGAAAATANATVADASILFTGHPALSSSAKKKKRKRDEDGKKPVFLADVWRKVQGQEASDRNLRQHFMQDMLNSKKLSVKAKILGHEFTSDGLMRFRLQEPVPMAPKFELILNQTCTKGDLKSSRVGTALEIHKPWNEYLLKDGTKLIFNPSKVKYTSLPTN